MPVVKCKSCQREFEAKRSTAQFCSDRCRQRWHRRMAPIVPENPAPVERQATMEDVLSAVGDARRVSNNMMQLSECAPRSLRPGCARIATAIALAIAEEEW